jgi:hypothetical protein
MMQYYSMNSYLSCLSAAIFWDVPHIETVIGRKITVYDVVEITVSDFNACFYTKGKRVYSCRVPLPDDAVISQNGIRVASPELLFLEFARRLDIRRLILFGLQLCAHKPGQPYDALTTKRKLEVFLAKTPGHWGHH